MESHAEASDAGPLERWLPSALGAVLFPLAYLGVYSVTTWLRDAPLELYPSHLVIWFLALGVLGALTVEGWQRGLRLFPLLAWAGTLPWSWQYAGEIARLPVLTFLFVGGLLVVGVVEWGVRFSGAATDLLATRAGLTALGAGVAHLVVGLHLQSVASDGLSVAGIGLFWWLILVLSGLALVAMGALPLLLWVRWRLVAPLLWVVFQLSLALVWLVLSGDVPDMHVSDGMSLTLYPNYLVNWGLPLLLLLVLAGVEYGARALWADVRDPR